MTRILFVTTSNAVRAQMAQAIFESLAGNDFEVAVASTDPQTMGRLSRVVLAEAGVRISAQPPKTVDQAADQHWDRVITVAGEDEMPAPPVAGIRNERWAIRNPLAIPGFSARLAGLRFARDSIRAHVEELLATLQKVAA
jgi:protein-tyrosine-phosphatase